MHWISSSRVVHVNDEEKAPSTGPSEHKVIFLSLANLHPLDPSRVGESLFDVVGVYRSLRMIVLNVAPVELIPNNRTVVHTFSIYIANAAVGHANSS